jgi:protein TonB
MIPAHANGSAPRMGTPSTMGAEPSREPLAAVLEMGRNATRGVVMGLLVALLFHGAAAADAAALPLDFMRWSREVGERIHARLWESYDIEMVKAVEPPPPPAPPPEEAKEEPKAAAPPPPTRVKDEPPPPPPAAAQASAVLTKEPDSNEPVDLTGNTFVNGTAETYAGGVTEQGGTSDKAVYDRNARAGGVPGGHGTGAVAAPAPAPDRSRQAGLNGSSEWKCPWPSEADTEQVDDAYVTVQVAIRPDGAADRVTVLTDPGHGFAREARLCAMRERYTPALDRDGNPIAGISKAFKIHFER